jgi:hypothetical protein
VSLYIFVTSDYNGAMSPTQVPPLRYSTDYTRLSCGRVTNVIRCRVENHRGIYSEDDGSKLHDPRKTSESTGHKGKYKIGKVQSFFEGETNLNLTDHWDKRLERLTSSRIF